MGRAKTFLVASGILAIAQGANIAQAQQWSALDREPLGSFVLPIDNSMTMAQDLGGSYAPNSASNHFNRAKRVFIGVGTNQDSDGAMEIFRDSFVWGTYAYSGARYAKIKPGTTVAPLATDVAGSYERTWDEINGMTVDYCVATKTSPDCRERYLPGGAGVNCITATAPTCGGDQVVLEAIITGSPGSLGGLVLPNLPSIGTSSQCDNLDPTGYPDYNAPAALPPGCPDPANLACPALDPVYELWHELQASNWSYPRYNANNPPTPQDIQDDICSQFTTAFDKLNLKLQACLTNPSGFVNMNAPPFSCNPNALANTICQPNSPFGTAVTPNPTCVCDQSNPNCTGGGPADNDCGRQYVFRARQQVAMCYSHDPNRPIYAGVRSPADDSASVDPTRCRPSVVGFVTDGRYGYGATGEGVPNQLVYRAENNLAQNFVFRMGNDTSSANLMQSLMRGGLPVPSFSSENVDAVRSLFGRLRNRSQRGTYSGGAPALSKYQDRAAFMVFEVPGALDPTHFDYLGQPARIEYYEIDPDTGAVTNLIFHTDDSNLAGVGSLLNPARDYLGPAGTWRSGVNKVLPNVTGLDRDGDGAADAHNAVTWGYHLGGEGSRPIIVGKPSNAVVGSFDPVNELAWQQVYEARDRVIYALSNGYVHAYRAGVYIPNGSYTVGSRLVLEQYDEAAAGVGEEIFRYRPTFVEDANNLSAQLVGNAERYRYNDVVQQPLLLGGQLYARDVQLSANPSTFATVLLISQGRSGQGYAALDVSDPNSPTVLWDRVLLPTGANGGLATSEPVIYDFPSATNEPNPALVITGGGQDNQIYAFNVATGAQMDSAPLPAGQYPNAPVCVDLDGKGRSISHCFILSSAGQVLRGEVTANGTFGSIVNITPGGVGGNGQVFNAGLVVYFTAENATAIAFGSGDITMLERGDGVANSFYKIVDDYSRTYNPVTTARLADVCAPNQSFVTGEFSLPAGEMVVSPPTVAKGTLAFTTYRPGSTGCQTGTARLYAADFQTCRDASNNNATVKPPGQDIGAGIPSSPTILRSSEHIMVHSSNAPTGTNAASVQSGTRGGVRETLRAVYWKIRSILK